MAFEIYSISISDRPETKQGPKYQFRYSFTLIYRIAIMMTSVNRKLAKFTIKVIQFSLLNITLIIKIKRLSFRQIKSIYMCDICKENLIHSA